MRLPLDWILKDPIDMEHKEYVLLDYISKIDKDLESFKLYPTFQELSLHLANLGSINKNLSTITLINKPKSIDDEILLADIEYKKLKQYSNKKLKDIVKISKKSHDKLKDYFLIAKTIWSIVFESVIVVDESKDINTKNKVPNKGYIYFVYNGDKMIYKFKIKKLHPKYNEVKCTIKRIKKEIPKDSRKWIFRVEYTNNFPLEGCLLSVIKRKVMNHISQTVNLKQLKNSNG